MKTRAHNTMSLLQRLKNIPQHCRRWWNLIRYHRTSQLTRRLMKQVQSRFRKSRPPMASSFSPVIRRQNSQNILRNIAGRKVRIWNRRLQTLQPHLTSRQFTYLNSKHDFGGRVDWRINHESGISDLWRFHLHYQDELLAALVDPAAVAARQAALQLVEEWIQGNHSSNGLADQDAWHPFCISRRIINWILLFSASESDQPSVPDHLIFSLAEQAEHLHRHLEWDIRGNHLLVNLQAIAMAAVYFSGGLGDRLLRTVESHLLNQFDEQILPWGEHFERSPMYHAQMLEAVLDVRDALSELSPALSMRSASVADRMARFLNGVLHPDGQIPLLGDSAFDMTPDPTTLISAATQTSASQRLTGANSIGDYWTFRDDNNFLLFDCGPVGTDELPAHAHCDLLSFEASFNGTRIFVDSGVYDYEESPMREYCRSTRAHNALQIDEREQCDVWGKFRMGARGRPLQSRCGTDGRWSWKFASHNAYRFFGVPEVGRWFGAAAGGPWVCVDSIHGVTTTSITLRWHLAPEVSAQIEVASIVRLKWADGELILQLPAGGQCDLNSYWYCPEFGRKEQGKVIVWQSSQKLPCRLIWSIHTAEQFQEMEMCSSNSARTAMQIFNNIHPDPLISLPL